MKKSFATLSIAFGLTCMQSCVSSLQPLVTLETITTDQRITGKWASDKDVYTIKSFPQSEYAKEMGKIGGDKKEQKPLSADEKRDSVLYSKMYIVSFQKDGASYYMAAKLIKINGQLFADLYPAAMNDTRLSEDQPDPYSVNQDYLPGYTIAKIEMNGNSGMTIKFIDGDFVITQVKEGRMKLKHESNELFGTFMVTASTEELKQFISKYGNDERIFSKNTAITLTRKLNL
jgi:hypothetical protein